MTVAGVMQWTSIALTAYLCGIVVLGLGARVARWRPLQRAAEVLTPGVIRRAVAVIAGVGVSVPAIARAQTTTDPPVVMHRLPAPSSTSSTSTSAPLTTTTTRVPVPTIPAQSPPRSDWTVRPGQNFWAVAAATLHDAWNRDTTAREVVPYWRQLIETNRARLREPTNPNLIYPGQEFELPPF